MKEKRCIGCGTMIPRNARRKGWTIVMMYQPGKGTRWYRNCGCLSRHDFYDLLDWLFETNRDYTSEKWDE